MNELETTPDPVEQLREKLKLELTQDNPGIKLTPEQQEAFTEAFRRAVEAVREIVEALQKALQVIIDAVREIGINSGRFFLKLQLLQWKLPYPIADFIAKNTPWHWAVRLGFNWAQRKFSLIE